MLKILILCYIKTMINTALNKLIDGKELSNTDIKETFDEITHGLCESQTAGAFISAFKINDINANNVASAILSCSEAISHKNLYNGEKIIQNISLEVENNSFDMPLAIDLVCSACNLGTVKYAINHPKRKNKSFEILKHMGINPEEKQAVMLSNFEEIKFAYFYLDNLNPYLKYTLELSSKLPFYNILNITDLFLNPANAKNCTIGVKTKEEAQKYADICLKCGYTNSLVMTGADNQPYISYQGESFIAEAWKNKIFTYTITPELLGFKVSDDDTKCENNEQNAKILLDVFCGKMNDTPWYITILINCALALYISKNADSIASALKTVKQALDSNLVEQKISQLKNL